jgi:hypothetical protein
MPIHRLLNDAAFGPDDIGRMVAAYEGAIELIRPKDRTPSMAELIAAKIIQVYRIGERDPPRICARAIKELGIPID